MSDVFSSIWGQPYVREYLRRSTAGRGLGQSYLFCGPVGSGKTAAAYALAQYAMCEAGGCGSCETCRAVQRRTHPDVHHLSPEGVSSYLVSQVRGLIADTSRAPIRGKVKVYIVERVDLMDASAANAFLKTLEEPPTNVIIVLLARTRDSVLPTILSRCQVVPFRSIPEKEAIGLIRQNTGVGEAIARAALGACDGSVEEAVSFARSHERLEFRRKVMEGLRRLRSMSDWDVLCLSKELVVACDQPLDEVREQQQHYLEQNEDFLSAGAKSAIKKNNERMIKSKRFRYTVQMLSCMTSWLRDVALVCAGADALLANEDQAEGIRECARWTNEAHAASACQRVFAAREALAYNVSPQTCVDVLLLEIREVLYGANCTG